MLDLTPYKNIESWVRFSNEIGGYYIASHLSQSPRVRYTYKYWLFEFDKYKRGGGKSIIQYTRLRVAIKAKEDIRFKLSNTFTNSIMSMLVPTRNQVTNKGFKIEGENTVIIQSITAFDPLDNFLKVRNEVEVYISKHGLNSNEEDEYCLCLNRLGEWKDRAELMIWLNVMREMIDYMIRKELIDDCKVTGHLI